MSQTVPTQAKRSGGLSVSQMLHLMRLEVSDAQFHGYPISCLMIALDGFDAEDDVDWQRVIVRVVYNELKQLTVERSIRGLALKKGHLIVATLPHATPTRAAELAEELLDSIRSIVFEDLEDRPVTLSIGIGHNQHSDPTTFETFIEEAETGLNLARSGGGDRCVQWKQVETELDRLRIELENQIKDLETRHLADKGRADDDFWGKGLVAHIVQVFAQEENPSEATVRLKAEVIALVDAEIERWSRDSTVQQLADSAKQVDLLERRLRKLTEHLSGTEAELKRVAAMKVVDGGLASIYQDLQGLSAEDDAYESKKAMLSNIFEANLALRDASKE